MTKQKILDAYADGSTLSLIIESFNITHSRLIQTLIDFKEDSRYKKTFTDEFKKMIAQRDMNGVARSTIAKELQINANTVKKSCEKFGQAIKDKGSSEKALVRIDGKFSIKQCPNCKSKKVNTIEEDTIYCKNCGDEYIYNEDHVLRVAWEHLEE